MRPSALPEIVPFVAAKPIEQPDIPPSADTASTPANGQPPNRLPPISAGQALKERWQLSGVARSGETSVVILRDRSSRETRRVTTDLDIGGWLVTDAGRDYAVLAQNGEEVRLELDEETGR